MEGMKAAMAPETRDPTRTNGKPSKARAKNEYKKFCDVKLNQLISSRLEQLNEKSDHQSDATNKLAAFNLKRYLFENVVLFVANVQSFDAEE